MSGLFHPWHLPLLEQDSLLQVSILEILFCHEAWRQLNVLYILWFSAHIVLHVLDWSHQFFKLCSHSLNWMSKIHQNTIQNISGSEYSRLPDASLAVNNQTAHQNLTDSRPISCRYKPINILSVLTVASGATIANGICFCKKEPVFLLFSAGTSNLRSLSRFVLN